MWSGYFDNHLPYVIIPNTFWKHPNLARIFATRISASSFPCWKEPCDSGIWVGCQPLEVFPNSSRGCWKDYIFCLAWEGLGIPQEWLNTSLLLACCYRDLLNVFLQTRWRYSEVDLRPCEYKMSSLHFILMENESILWIHVNSFWFRFLAMISLSPNSNEFKVDFSPPKLKNSPKKVPEMFCSREWSKRADRIVSSNTKQR